MPRPPEKHEKSDQDTFDNIIEAIDATESDPDRHLSIQIDSSLRDAIRAAQTSNQSAAVTLKITVKPGADRRVSFSANVAAKLPRPPVSAVTLYADAAGTLHKSDPAQMRLGLQALNPAASSTKEQ